MLRAPCCRGRKWMSSDVTQLLEGRTLCGGGDSSMNPSAMWPNLNVAMSARLLAFLLQIPLSKRNNSQIISYLFICFLFLFFIDFQVQLSAFSSHHSLHPSRPLLSPSPMIPPPLGFVHVSFIVVPESTFYLFFHSIISHYFQSSLKVEWKELSPI